MIKLGKQEHPIRLSNGAFTIYEDITGEDAFEVLGDPKKMRKAKSIQALLYGGLKMGYLYDGKECPLTYEEVGNLMDVRRIGEFLSLAFESLQIDEDLDVNDKKKVVGK